MSIQPINGFALALDTERSAGGAGPSFAATLGAVVDGVSHVVAAADGAAGALAAGKASVADAAITRAKADTMLEVLATAASRVSASVMALLQTQV